MGTKRVLSTPTGRILAAGLDTSTAPRMPMWRIGVSAGARWHTGHCARSAGTAPDATPRDVVSQRDVCLDCLSRVPELDEWVSASKLLPGTFANFGNRAQQAEHLLRVAASIRSSHLRFSPALAGELARVADELEVEGRTFLSSDAFVAEMVAECEQATRELAEPSEVSYAGPVLASQRLDAEGAGHCAGDGCSVGARGGVAAGGTVGEEHALVLIWAGGSAGSAYRYPAVGVLTRWARLLTRGVEVGNDYARLVAAPPAFARLAVAVERLPTGRPVCEVFGFGGSPEALRAAAQLAQRRLIEEQCRKMRPTRALVEQHVAAFLAAEV